MIPMRRDAVGHLFDASNDIHTGLWLARGLKKWDPEATQKGTDFQKHIQKASQFRCPEIYQSTYARWEHMIIAAHETIAIWCGQLDGRLFIGQGGASVLETAINLSHTYGVPMIPGTAIKGLVRAYAATQSLSVEHQQLLVGQGSEQPETSAAGHVLFHDAWWIPASAKTPLCPEIVTVHHQDYYSGKANRATDFDSPIPNAQIAARGSFLFALECGDLKWAHYARDLLAQALEDWGIGGKTAAGYGRFIEDKTYKGAVEAKRLAEIERVENEELTPEEKVLRDLQRAFEKAQQTQERAGGELSKLLNSLFEQGEQWNISHREKLADKIEEIYNTLKWWGNSKKKQEKKDKLSKLRGKK